MNTRDYAKLPFQINKQQKKRKKKSQVSFISGQSLKSIKALSQKMKFNTVKEVWRCINYFSLRTLSEKSKEKWDRHCSSKYYHNGCQTVRLEKSTESQSMKKKMKTFRC